MTATITTITSQIEERLGDIRRALKVARDAIKEVEAEEKGLAQALRALDPTNALVAKDAPVPVVVAKPQRTPQQQVSEDLIARVRKVVADCGAPVTIGEIQAQVRPRVTDSAISSAIKVLRDRQEIRLAGQAPRRGKPNLYAPMNGTPPSLVTWGEGEQFAGQVLGDA